MIPIRVNTYAAWITTKFSLFKIHQSIQMYKPVICCNVGESMLTNMGLTWILHNNPHPWFCFLFSSKNTENNLPSCDICRVGSAHYDVIKWKHLPRNWPFVREIHRSPVNFSHKGQWRGALMFSLIYAWINDWVNNREAGDLRRQHGHYDVIVMHQNDQSLCLAFTHSIRE